MGNMIKSKQGRNKSVIFKINQYQEIESKQQFIKFPKTRILRHLTNFTEMEEYKLQFYSQVQILEYYMTYEWRLTQQFIVSTMYFLQSNKKQLCSNCFTTYVYIERIPLKFNRIKDIPYPDNLYILYSALNGFYTLYKKTSYFQVQEHMICINTQGKVKVWYNQNLSKSYVDPRYTEYDGIEQTMVKKIIMLIDEITDHQNQPISIKDYIENAIDQANFQEAILLLKQYQKQFKIEIPKQFKSIMKVLRDGTQSQNNSVQLKHSYKINNNKSSDILKTEQIQSSQIQNIVPQIKNNRLFTESDQTLIKNPNQLQIYNFNHLQKLANQNYPLKFNKSFNSNSRTLSSNFSNTIVTFHYRQSLLNNSIINRPSSQFMRNVKQNLQQKVIKLGQQSGREYIQNNISIKINKQNRHKKQGTQRLDQNQNLSERNLNFFKIKKPQLNNIVHQNQKFKKISKLYNSEKNLFSISQKKTNKINHQLTQRLEPKKFDSKGKDLKSNCSLPYYTQGGNKRYIDPQIAKDLLGMRFD